jgi:molybdate transport system regulatory protein
LKPGRDAARGGRILTAIITNDALQELGVAKGDSCSALIKASHFLMAVDT